MLVKYKKMREKFRILIIDDHVMFMEGLVNLFQTQPSFEVVGNAGSVTKAIQLYEKLKPDILLLDNYLPDGTGLDVIDAVIEKDPEAIILLLTRSEDDEMVYSAIRSGAKGCLSKSQP